MSNAEFKQIKVLNSILLKEVTESKDRIEELEQENQELKIAQEKIKKENENKYNNRIEKLEQENQQLKVEQEKIKKENKNKNTRIKKLEEENEILKIENEEIIKKNEINEKYKESLFGPLQKKEIDIMDVEQSMIDTVFQEDIDGMWNIFSPFF